LDCSVHLLADLSEKWADNSAVHWAQRRAGQLAVEKVAKMVVEMDCWKDGCLALGWVSALPLEYWLAEMTVDLKVNM
jgi:hypothetical protein